MLLEAKGVALVRGRQLLFEGLDLALEPGEALHLTGPNGSGKSSLIRAIADEGLALDREFRLRRALGFWRGPRLNEAMAAFDLDRLADVPVRMLSTGQAKRARLARVMASGAPLWLLDEPLNGLDRDGVARLDTVIEAHRSAGCAVVAASHVVPRGEWRTLELGR